MAENKKELRHKYKELRQKLNSINIDEMSLEIANQVLKLDIWNKTYFHIYLPIESLNEVNTEFILHILHGKDKEIIISKSDFKTLEMTHVLLTENTKIQKNKNNISEPIDGIEVSNNKIEVVFVPLIAYDKMGNRVGYGKGFYDRFLSNCNTDTVKIGLSFFEPEDLILDVFEKDVKLDFCVTTKTTYRF